MGRELKLFGHFAGIARLMIVSKSVPDGGTTASLTRDALADGAVEPGKGATRSLDDHISHFASGNKSSVQIQGVLDLTLSPFESPRGPFPAHQCFDMSRPD